MAWSKAYLPKVEGGLCIINIKTKNKALLFKFHHKFFTKAELPGCNLLCLVYTRLTLHLMQENMWDPSGGEI